MESKTEPKRDLDEGKDKIYMNLNLQYKPDTFSSIASGDFNLVKPVVDHGGNFQLTITDIQIDTRLIPLFIAELKQYQNYSSLYTYPLASRLNSRNDSYFLLNYWVTVKHTSTVTSDFVYLRKPVLEATTSKSRNGTNNEYTYDNNNKNLYIYSYQEFLDMVNDAIYRSLPAAYRNKGNCGFIIRNDRLVFIIQNKELFQAMQRTNTNKLEIWFSPSLFQYLGCGFPIRRQSTHWNFEISEFESFDNQYYALIQNASCLQSWNCCKAIVIYSRNFPVAEEIFPTLAINDGITHYKSTDYSMRHIYGSSELKKKIIYIHYINYAKVGSLANGITEHNICVDNGLKIDLEKALPINKFDINVGWIDSFGNLFPLELPYGGCCNIRMCFSRRYNKEMFDYRNNYNMNSVIYPYYTNDEGGIPLMDNNDFNGLAMWTPSYNLITPIDTEEKMVFTPISPEYTTDSMNTIKPIIPMEAEDVLGDDIGEIPKITPLVPITSVAPANLDLSTKEIPEEDEDMDVEEDNQKDENNEVEHVPINEEKKFYENQNGILNKFKNFVNSFINKN